MDRNIMLCRPRDDELLMRITLEKGLNPDIIPKVYTGSVERNCERCDLPVWLGPRLKAMYSDDPESYELCCFFCVAVESVAQGGDIPYVSLDNPEFDK